MKDNGYKLLNELLEFKVSEILNIPVTFFRRVVKRINNTEEEKLFDLILTKPYDIKEAKKILDKNLHSQERHAIRVLSGKVKLKSKIKIVDLTEVNPDTNIITTT